MSLDHVSDTHRGQQLWNVPNILTIIRLALTPILLGCVIWGSPVSQWVALVVFLVAAYTDHLDGKIARRDGLITDFGKIWDPIADKFLTLGSFVVLSIVGHLPWWFTILVAVRELGITWMRSRLLARGIVVAANSGGKAKTVSQMMLIAVLLVPWDVLTGVDQALTHIIGLRIVVWGLIAVVLTLTLWSGFVYVLDAWTMRRRR